MKRLLLVAGIFILFATEILRIYFIMPFPGSQQRDTLEIAYFIGRNILIIRIIGLALVLPQAIHLIKGSRRKAKILFGITALLYFLIFFFFNFRFEADKMFRQTRALRFAGAAENKVALDNLVIGIDSGGFAKAYPIQFIGYHHQVRDSVAGTAVMITYCTVCRTGRVYSPLVNNEVDSFRLVGMDYFNAMFEDSRTRSWWQQATGVAVAGPLKGTSLREWPSQQATLGSWLSVHPSGMIMQPDTLFSKDYDDLKAYDKGLQEGHLEKRDSLSGSKKSWVLGLISGRNSKAYDWNLFADRRIINDVSGETPVLLYLEKDTATFHAWNRNMDGSPLWFEKNSEHLTDTNTRSIWSDTGVCIDGPLKGRKLTAIPVYQEFLHSWVHFHPRTELYKP